MSPLTLLFRLPLIPIQAVVKLGEVLDEQAERELHDPARVRRELEEAQHKAAIGEISEDELSRVESAATSRLVTPVRPGSPGRRQSRR
jgi:hypothetical protein